MDDEGLVIKHHDDPAATLPPRVYELLREQCAAVDKAFPGSGFRSITTSYRCARGEMANSRTNWTLASPRLEACKTCFNTTGLCMLRLKLDSWVILPVPKQLWPKDTLFDTDNAAFYCNVEELRTNKMLGIWDTKPSSAKLYA
jgi:hypothetical protein